MGLRAMFATVIATLLLAISCAATACEVSCSAAMLAHGCAHAGLAAQADASMAGGHCGMQMGSRSATSSHSELSGAGACAHAVCEQQPIAVAHDTRTHTAQLAAAPQSALVAVMASLPTARARRPHAAETPPLRAPLVVSLQNILRV